MPASVSPALIPAAPMAHTSILPANAMAAKPQSAIQGANWTQIPGAANFAAAAPDGSLWVLSTAPSGADKYIWHYASGTWTNISGLATRIAVAPNGTLYAINSGGGAFSYSGGTWTSLGGGCTDITAAKDGSIYVLSNGNSAGSDQPIWHYTSSWAQAPGSGVRIAGSWDANSYALASGTLTSGGFYILNSAGSIYYENPNNSFVLLTGSASAIAPTTIGGIFVLSYPASSGGNTIYYYNFNTPGWTAQAGSGVSISTDSAHVYAIGTTGAIYGSPVTTSATQHLYVADDSGSGMLRVYELPLTSSSTPTASFSAPSSLGVAANSSTVAVSFLNTTIQTFTQPVSSASMPAATFAKSANGLVGFAGSGKLDSGSGATLAIYTPPFSNSTTPSSTITTAVSSWGVADDTAGSGNIYIGTSNNTIYVAAGGSITTTVTGPSGRFYRGIAATSSQLFACNVAGSGSVDVYSLPLSASSSPVAMIVTGIPSGGAPEGCAVDANGNLYVGVLNAPGTVLVYSPPFSSSSAPTVTLSITGDSIFGLGVGP